MALDVETKDCTALSDAELAEMADICVDGPARYTIGLISKQVDEWVLVTQVRDGGKLAGFSFSTLERIGGTPALLIGMASIRRTSKRGSVLRAMMADMFRRSVLAFPDEDVLVGSQFLVPDAYEAFKSLTEIVPRPGHKASGEERAWGRRLAKRFGVKKYDAASFTVAGGEEPTRAFDIESAKPESIDKEIAKQFAKADRAKGDALVVFGWAMAEDLASLGD